MRENFFIYDAFTSQKFGGNPAGIVLDAEEIEREERQALARELGFSETVFIERGNHIWNFRYFTPKEEVDLCGHATIAGVYALVEQGFVVLGKEAKQELKISTNLGELSVFLEQEEGRLLAVTMEQDQGQIARELEVSEHEILQALSLDMTARKQDFPMVKAYSGLWDLLIPLNTKQDLQKIGMQETQVKELSKKLGVISFHPFVIEGKNAYVRNFAPIVDIPEEAATGTSNGALAYYLMQEGYLAKEEKLSCHQGESMGRASQILAKISNEGKILVGGKAVLVLKGTYPWR